MTESFSGELLEIDLSDAENVSRQALAGFVSPRMAVDEVIAQLMDAELRGKSSHGLVRIPWLKERLGQVSHLPPVKSEIMPWFSRFECHKSLGYVAVRDGQRELQRILRDQPFGMVVCAGAFPSGVVGDYLRPLADSGYVALGFATSPPLVSLTPGDKPVLGTNPVAVAMPGATDKPAFVADISPAPATFGQLLAMLFGAKGELGELSVTTSDGKTPTKPNELFDNHIRLTGQILQRFATTTQRRQYALTLAIELLTNLFAGENPQGALILLAFDAQRLPGMHPDAAAGVIEQIAHNLDWQAIPGSHGEARLLKLRRQGNLPLPQPLWQTLQAMAESDS